MEKENDAVAEEPKGLDAWSDPDWLLKQDLKRLTDRRRRIDALERAAQLKPASLSDWLRDAEMIRFYLDEGALPADEAAQAPSSIKNN